VLLLGGSGGILRALAIQLIFGERVPVYAVHYDSEKLQIGGHQARAIEAAANESGVPCMFFNRDATKPDAIEEVVAEIATRHRVVHVVNGIAAGATKRFAEHGPAQVRDLDVAFDPVRQVADFSSIDNVRRLGLVDVETASEADIERTYKFMGHSTTPWVEALAAKGLLAEGESLVSFADYEYEPDDPVYAMGPLAQAKVLQRAAMAEIKSRYGVRTVRLRYPAMNTTAIGAIPGGLLMFAGTAELLLARGEYQNIPQLARATMPVFDLSFREEVADLDAAYQRILPDFHRFKNTLTNDRAALASRFEHVLGNAALLPRGTPRSDQRGPTILGSSSVRGARCRLPIAGACFEGAAPVSRRPCTQLS
jgi:enoyl-[acyl-carrier protein] reductase/trans-2-enoyl-CoA reductase (NAD+)